MSLDLDNDAELEKLMADLEAQTDAIEPVVKVEPIVEPVVEDEPEIEIEIDIENEPEIEVEPVVAVGVVTAQDEPEIEIDIEDEPEIEVEALSPTAVDKLNAEQQTGLEEAFEAPTEVEIEIEPPTSKISPLDEAIVAPQAKESATPIEESVVSPTESLEAERHSREFEPEPESEDGDLYISEKFAKEKFKLQFRPNVDLFQADTRLTDATLDQCMENQASLVAIHTSRLAQADAQAARAKLKFEMVEAGLYDAWRRELAKHHEKVTEKAIENAVRTDKKWIASKLALIEANTYADIHKGFVSSLQDRRAMLIQRGSDRREEMKGQMRIVGSANTHSAEPQQLNTNRSDLSANASEIARRALAQARG